MSLAAPSVVKTVTEDGIVMEPWEKVDIEVENEHSSAIIERMSSRGAKVSEIKTVGERQSLSFEVSTAAFMGVRSWVRDVTGGTAVVLSEFKELRPEGPPHRRERNGVLIVNTAGIASSVDLGKAARHGKLFIGEGMEVYPGLIFGECLDDKDIDTNISRPHDGYRKAESVGRPAEKTLEQALTYILHDEKVEVTPKRIVMRKAILDANDRKTAAKQAMKSLSKP